MAHEGFVLVPETMTTPTLLLVESPGIESQRYRTLGRRAGFKILTTNSGPMARVVSRRSRPNLVLLSPLTGPPGASEIARSIKEDPDTEDIPIMIVVRCAPSDPAMTRVYPTEACASHESSDKDLVKTMRAVRSRRQRGRLASGRLSPLEGDISEDTFPGVLEFLFTSRKTGRIIVVNGTKWPGRIYIEEGNVVHAELAEQRGAEAFRRMCYLTHGRFMFEPEFRPAQQTMTENGMEMLLRSARCRDESTRLNGQEAGA